MRIKALASLAFGLLISSTAVAQVTWINSVGVARPVPDTSGNFNGAAATLCGYYCPNLAQPLFFEFDGIDGTWNTPSPLTDELIFLAIDTPFASLPGCPIGGGTVYLPSCLGPSTILLGPVSSSYIGPFPLCIGGSGLCGPTTPAAFARLGARWGLTIPPGVVGVFSAQAVMIDPATGKWYTSNALNVSIP